MILDRGITAVSVRAVAEQAGVAVGSLRHVFPTRADLMAFSADLMIHHATERVTAVLQGDDVEECAMAVIEQVLPLSNDGRAEFEVNMALMAEAAAQPELAKTRDEAHRLLSELFLRVAEMVTGMSRENNEVRQAARRLHALVDGLSFHLLHHSPEDDPGWALDIMRAEVANLHRS